MSTPDNQPQDEAVHSGDYRILTHSQTYPASQPKKTGTGGKKGGGKKGGRK